MKELSEIKKILSHHIDLKVNDIFIFGSRAKGTNRNNSDLDILIIDNIKINPSAITRLIEEFEESNVPFKVDIVIRSRIDDDFYDKIRLDLLNIS